MRPPYTYLGSAPGAASVVSPLNVAAVVTWLAVAGWPVLEWLSGRLPSEPATALGLLALGAFLGLLILRAAYERLGPPRLVAARRCVLLQLPIALVAIGTLPHPTQAILLVIVAAQLAAHFSPRVTLALLAAANVVAGGLFLLHMAVAAALITLLSFIGFQLFAMLVARYAREAETARDAALAAHGELLAAQRLLADSTRAEERLRLARELHDVAGHKLTGLKLQLELAQRRAAPELHASLQELKHLADELLGDIRGVVGAMRQHEGIDLPSALEALAQAFPSWLIELDIDRSLRLPGMQQAEALLRCAQEGVTNALRHGGATRIRIRLQRTDAGCELVVEDNGRGMQGQRDGHGLQGLRERLDAIAGRLELEELRPSGVRLRAWAPA